MVRPPRRKDGGRGEKGGRVTPKETRQRGTSGRYTPPTPRSVKVSPRWVPVLMFALLALGLVVIMLNYMGVVLPGATSNWYLLLGLGLILGGIITATQYH